MQWFAQNQHGTTVPDRLSRHGFPTPTPTTHPPACPPPRPPPHPNLCPNPRPNPCPIPCPPPCPLLPRPPRPRPPTCLRPRPPTSTHSSPRPSRSRPPTSTPIPTPMYFKKSKYNQSYYNLRFLKLITGSVFFLDSDSYGHFRDPGYGSA